jgi:ABC-2 type transport system ATP-binding protein
VSSPIECTNLRKTYDGKVEAVRGLSLHIEAGECFGLLGPNGAGKTTTIEILEGILAPTSGEVRIFGHSWNDNPRQLREWIGISLQETRLSEKLSVRETIELFASFYEQPRRRSKSSKTCSSLKSPTAGWANSPAARSSASLSPQR